MSERKKIAKEVLILKEEIQQLEIRRSRSQASIIMALIGHKEPDADDVKFFLTFTSEIEFKREQMQKLASSIE